MVKEVEKDRNKKRKRKSKSFYPVKKRRAANDDVIVTTTSSECCFCKEKYNPQKYGAWFSNEEEQLAAHQFCLLFASGLPQLGNDEEGFEGFLFKDIRRELERTKTITCTKCRIKGASSGCSVKNCHAVYHFGCGLRCNVQFIFKDSFDSYCQRHRSKQILLGIKGSRQLKCPICFEEIQHVDHTNIVKTPCCKAIYLHKACVKTQASISGYFFRCPMCNNTEDFINEMQSYGIYIPQRDAAWEKEDAFSHLLQTYNRCDFVSCQYPHYSTKAGKYRLLLCTMCGQSAVHHTCFSQPCANYVCAACNLVAKSKFTVETTQDETRVKEHKRRLSQLTSSEDPVLLSSADFAPIYWRNKFHVTECRVELEDCNHALPVTKVCLPSPVPKKKAEIAPRKSVQFEISLSPPKECRKLDTAAERRRERRRSLPCLVRSFQPQMVTHLYSHSTTRRHKPLPFIHNDQNFLSRRDRISKNNIIGDSEENQRKTRSGKVFKAKSTTTKPKTSIKSQASEESFKNILPDSNVPLDQANRNQVNFLNNHILTNVKPNIGKKEELKINSEIKIPLEIPNKEESFVKTPIKASEKLDVISDNNLEIPFKDTKEIKIGNLSNQSLYTSFESGTVYTPSETFISNDNFFHGDRIKDFECKRIKC